MSNEKKSRTQVMREAYVGLCGVIFNMTVENDVDLNDKYLQKITRIADEIDEEFMFSYKDDEEDE